MQSIIQFKPTLRGTIGLLHEKFKSIPLTKSPKVQRVLHGDIEILCLM